MSNKDDLEGEMESHPAFGLAHFNRVTFGGGSKRQRRLFGSSIDSLGAITLTISNCRVQHSLGSDHYYDDKEIIQVEMTEAQFASLISTLNQGQGVPVTIRHIQHKRMPELPESKVEAIKIRDTFHERLEAWKKQMNTITDEVDAITSKKGALTVAEKERIKELTTKLVHRMQDSSGFLLDQFNESMTGIVAEAKTEVEGFINNAIQKTGLKALQGQAVNLLGLDTPKKDGE